MRGSVTRLNKKIGFGFIVGDDGLEASFDLSSLEGVDIETLCIGTKVEYQEHFACERLRAVKVRILSNPRRNSASES